jgi:hypothetical protein
LCVRPKCPCDVMETISQLTNASVPKPTNESSFCVQGLDVLSDVIYHLETFDVTTIRASTPMFLLARRIKVFLDLVFLIRI